MNKPTPARRRVIGPSLRNPSITPAGADYAVRFDRSLLNQFKGAVPENERRWYKDRNVWLVTPAAIQQAKEFLEGCTQATIIVPELPPASTQLLGRTFLLEYVGATKARGGQRSAYGFSHGDWSVKFPEDVLRQFFEGYEQKQPAGSLQTLYQVLCVFESASPEQVKSAYRRFARQWHPDVCKEENADEMFRKINEAYLVLIDPQQRKRYDAGLYFERQGQEQTAMVRTQNKYSYRPPLCCGQLTARGTVRLMRFVVSEILKWDDAVNDQGRVMISSWPAGADNFQILWV